MYNFKDFKQYLLENSWVYDSHKKRFPSLIDEKFSGLDSGVIDLITRHMISKNTRVWDSKKYCFSYTGNSISMDLSNSNVLDYSMHEFGHLVDHIETIKVGKYKWRLVAQQVSKTSKWILSNGLTFHDTLKEELKANARYMLEHIKAVFEKMVVSNFGKEFFDKFLHLNNLLEECKSLSRKLGYIGVDRVDLVTPKLLDNPKVTKYFSSTSEIVDTINKHNHLTDILGDYSEINAFRRALFRSYHFSEFDRKYHALTDVLFYVYDKLPRYLPGHSHSYMKAKGALGSEFFANCFASKTVGALDELEIIKSFLPKTYAMFEELFELIINS